MFNIDDMVSNEYSIVKIYKTVNENDIKIDKLLDYYKDYMGNLEKNITNNIYSDKLNNPEKIYSVDNLNKVEKIVK